MTSLLLESVPGFPGSWAFPGLKGGGSMTAVMSLSVLMKIKTGAGRSPRWKW